MALPLGTASGPRRRRVVGSWAPGRCSLRVDARLPVGSTNRTLPAPQAGTLKRGTVRRWTWPQYLALTGLPILVWNVWTVVAWLADGPHRVTQYQQKGSGAQYSAYGLEAGLAVLSVGVLVWIIRTCVQRRQVLTFDVMFVLCGATLFWANMGAANFFVPTILMSSNFFVSLNDPCGYMPFVVNPACGTLVQPVAMLVMMQTFAMLALAVAA